MNIAIWDRILRFGAGIVLVAWAVAGGPWWAYLGLVFLATAAWRFCPLYAVLRTGTQRTPSASRSPSALDSTNVETRRTDRL